ncbi:MAG: S1 RNA-binding domain-containing protein [Spirochaetota bacterium]|nr:S1 RNA-binding domain-containing protein [Spirochaetota bacterium]
MEELNENSEESIDMQEVTDTAFGVVPLGKVIQGEVVTVDDEFVYVNVGTKSDGRVSIDEFDINPEIGSVVEVMLVNRRMIDGMYVFSKRIAEEEKRWLKFIETHKDKSENILGTIKNSVNKGILVDCGGVNAFLPFSHTANIRVGKTNVDNAPIWFKIKGIDEERKTVIISRKEYLEEERERQWNNFVSKYSLGDRVMGRVARFVESGAIIDIEGLKAYVNKNDMSWRKVFKQKKILTIGEEREFVLLNYNREEGKISLGIKQLIEDPWLRIDEKYHVDDVVSGRVVTLTDSGVYIEIEEGIEGFLNSYNISWTKRNVNSRDVFHKGELIDVKVLDINKEEGRISLGYKQLHPNPWDTIEESFGIDSVHRRKIKKIVSFGMFVELMEGIDGLIHISDVSWDGNSQNSLGSYKIGNEVEFKILDIKSEDMKISCGIKQLTKSPWEVIKEKYPAGSVVAGIISGIVPFGLFIKINDDVEGLVHISEVSHRRVDNLAEQYKISQQVSAIILGIDVEKKRLSLSIKEYNQIMEEDEVNKILSDTSPKRVTIGDIIKMKNEV